MMVNNYSILLCFWLIGKSRKEPSEKRTLPFCNSEYRFENLTFFARKTAGQYALIHIVNALIDIVDALSHKWALFYCLVLLSYIALLNWHPIVSFLHAY